jgi:hypothetical protein
MLATKSEMQQMMTELGEDGAATEYNLLESMIEKGGGESKGEITDEMRKIMEQRTVPMTPLMGLNDTDGGGDDKKARIEKLLEASIRTEKTIVIDKEDGKVIEEADK